MMIRFGFVRLSLVLLISGFNTCHTLTMELFSRRRWRLVSAQLSKNLVMALYTLSLLFFKFINTTAYHLGRYEPSSPVSCHTPCTDNFILQSNWRSFEQFELWCQLVRAIKLSSLVEGDEQLDRPNKHA